MAHKDQPSPPEPSLPAEEVNEVTETYAVAKRLLPFLAKRCIPASPKNYRIFYDYLVYSNPLLIKTVNELLEQDAKFLNELSSSLYEVFYSAEVLDSQTRAINQATQDFMTVSSAMERNLETALNRTSHYQKVLNNSSRQMAQMTSADEFQSVLEELVSETEAALADNDQFSNQLSAANQTIAQLQTELNNQATLARIDELTKLYNRRHLNVEAPKLLAQATRTGQPLSAVMFDLDHFKRINDTWGHNFGDKVLTICATIIKRVGRPADLAVRLGGEEFLLLCPDMGLTKAAEVAELVREEIATTDLTIRGQSLLLTISGGVAQHVAGEDLTALLERADAALYQAKKDGRNLIRLAPEKLEPTPEAPASGCPDPSAAF